MKIVGTKPKRRVVQSIEFIADEEIAHIGINGTIETAQEAEINNGSRKTLALLTFHMVMSISANILGSHYFLLTGTINPKFDLSMTLEESMNETITMLKSNETDILHSYKSLPKDYGGGVLMILVTISIMFAAMSRFKIIHLWWEPAHVEYVNVKLLRCGFLFTSLIIIATSILYAIFNPLQLLVGPNNRDVDYSDNDGGLGGWLISIFGLGSVLLGWLI